MDTLALLAHAHKAFLRFPAGRSRDLAADLIDYLTGELTAGLGDAPAWRAGDRHAVDVPGGRGEPTGRT